MDSETLIKYLEFLKTECLRHSKDNLIIENELNLLQLEIDKFKALLEKSELNSNIKEKINDINFNLSPLVRDKGFNILITFLGNFWTSSKQEEENNTKRVQLISEELENVIFEIRCLL